MVLTKKEVSCKGVYINAVNLSKDQSHDVIQNKSRIEAKNMAFRLCDNQIQTSMQQQTDLSYLYIKRKVLSDGVSTEPFIKHLHCCRHIYIVMRNEQKA